jgi:hypothetical protein
MLNEEVFKKHGEKRFECGAYIVRFHHDGEPTYIIVDDYLPTRTKEEGGGWLAGRAEDALTLWPNIIEKAYAKLYGGYQHIDAGGKL